MTTTTTAPPNGKKKVDADQVKRWMHDPALLEAEVERAASEAESNGDKARAAQLREALARKRAAPKPSTVNVTPGAIPHVPSLRPAGLTPVAPINGPAGATTAGLAQLQAHVDLRVSPLFAQLAELDRKMAGLTSDMGQLRVAMQTVENNIRTEIGTVATQLAKLLKDLGVKE